MNPLWFRSVPTVSRMCLDLKFSFQRLSVSAGSNVSPDVCESIQEFLLGRFWYFVYNLPTKTVHLETRTDTLFNGHKLSSAPHYPLQGRFTEQPGEEKKKEKHTLSVEIDHTNSCVETDFQGQLEYSSIYPGVSSGSAD